METLLFIKDIIFIINRFYGADTLYLQDYVLER